MLTWHERHGIKMAKPSPQIKLLVIRGSKFWQWRIEKQGAPSFMARGIADSAKDAKEAAEDAWYGSIEPSLTRSPNGSIVIYEPFDRRGRYR